MAASQRRDTLELFLISLEITTQDFLKLCSKIVYQSGVLGKI
jgi:hypothetical protein